MLRARTGINPDYAEAHLNLGLLAAAKGRYDETVNSLRLAIDIRPDYAAAHLALGRALSNLGRLDAAEVSLRRALSIEPESAEILCTLAMTLLLRDKCAEALQLIMRVLERALTWTTKRVFATCVARTRSDVKRLADPRGAHDRHHRNLGDSVRALPAGTWSDHVQSEHRQLRPPR